MATDKPTPQRAWRAACPNCGAPVDFLSAASTTAVCSFCRSTLARDGETLRRIGESAELFDDHSPLQLGASGTLQGVTFTLIGRIQYRYADGTWNEWYVLFDNGRNAWLSEDNGAYVLSFDTPLGGPAPAPGELQAGRRVSVDGAAWDIASVVLAQVLAAQGELPHPPRTGVDFTVVDLRNAMGEVATLDYADPAHVQFSLGRSATLAEFRLKGLKETSEKTLRADALACPQCGAPLNLQLSGTQALTCGQCKALVDVSQGVGQTAASVSQAPRPPAGRDPVIALGTTGRLAIGSEGVLDWQVVGYLVRHEIPGDAGEPPGYWSEYLLYHRTAGFAFLVDAEEGWSVVRPLTGAPQVKGREARWQGETYTQTWAYTAVVDWVAGEFYWRVRRDERAQVTDYACSSGDRAKRLSREDTGQEVTWSGGRTLSAASVAAAFRLPVEPKSRAPDVTPLASDGGSGVKNVLLLLAVVLIVIILFSRCGSDDCDEVANAYGAQSVEHRQCLQSRSSGSRSGGGSWGGFSTGGGGHK